MFTISETRWQKHADALSQIRRQVFIEEQSVPEELEWDAHDQDAVHLIAWSLGAMPVGCLRLLPNYSLGRMAVLAEFRGQGIGGALLAAAIDFAQEANWPFITLSAQTHAIGFYEQAGFIVESEEYLDANIPHRDMRLSMHFLTEDWNNLR